VLGPSPYLLLQPVASCCIAKVWRAVPRSLKPQGSREPRHRILLQPPYHLLPHSRSRKPHSVRTVAAGGSLSGRFSSEVSPRSRPYTHPCHDQRPPRMSAPRHPRVLPSAPAGRDRLLNSGLVPTGDCSTGRPSLLPDSCPITRLSRPDSHRTPDAAGPFPWITRQEPARSPSEPTAAADRLIVTRCLGL
jgi:hypothetical protein